ncbi:uncharacterized protein LOC134299412 [Anolis carolinensis]|uniref:uncharacterized protein LOC134299412 n=1 Tax=Anolis carolinensis TaxID=28377 RepID=UPI002F2B5477
MLPSGAGLVPSPAKACRKSKHLSEPTFSWRSAHAPLPADDVVGALQPVLQVAQPQLAGDLVNKAPSLPKDIAVAEGTGAGRQSSSIPLPVLPQFQLGEQSALFLEPSIQPLQPPKGHAYGQPLASQPSTSTAAPGWYYFGPPPSQGRPLSPGEGPSTSWHDYPPSYSGASRSDVPCFDSDMESFLSYEDFVALMVRLSHALKFSAVTAPQTVEDPMFPAEKQQLPTSAMVPALPYLLQLTKSPDVAPVAVLAVTRSIDNLYRVDTSSAPWIAKPPKPNSVVVDVPSSRRSRRIQPSPSDKEGRMMDTLARKVHLSAGLVVHIAHYQTYMAAYQTFLWGLCHQFYIVSDQHCQRADAFHHEVLLLAEQQKGLAMHSADTAGKLFASAMAMCRHASLHSSNLSEEGKAKAEDSAYGCYYCFSS